MSLSNGELSAADVAAVTGNNGGFMNGDASWWIIILFLFAFMGNGWGNGYGGNAGGAVPYVQQGFDQAAVMGGLNGINSSICAGFANAETAASARQIADMQQAFANQTAITAGMNTIASGLQSCCCENRQNIADLKYTVATEACADRSAVSDALRDVIAANTASTQRILDQMCQDKIDAKNEEIASLRQQMNMMQLASSQNAQTQALIANNEAQTAALEQYLAPVPRPAWIVQNPNGCNCGSYYNGCGCGA